MNSRNPGWESAVPALLAVATRSTEMEREVQGEKRGRKMHTHKKY
jgi:hypothetical protein